MGRKTFMVISWFWMAMAFDYFIIGKASSSTQPSSAYNFYTKYNNHEFNSTPIMDSELSGSERTRRLIPYMAFYLPPSEIPINQQYSIQKNRYSNNSIEQQPPPTAVESAGPEPSSDYITLPDYLKTSAIGETETTPIYNVQQQKQPRFRPIIYENQYTVPTNIKAANGNTQPILHLLPPGSAGRNGGSAFVGAIFRETHPSKHKTVQHFPPLKQHNELSQEHAPHPPQQQQQQQQEERQQQRFNEQPILYRQRLQPSKISFSPFTSSNAVPGHFVPIIYAPLRNSGKGDSSSNSNSKTINYNYDDSPVEQISQLQQHHHQQQQQQHQQYHHYDSSYKEVQQTQHQIMAEPNSLPPHVDATSSGKEAHLLYQQEKQQQQQYTQQQPQIDFIAIAGVTGPSSGGSTSTQSGIKNSQYMDEVVEDPKQALEEQYPQSIANQQAESPPQAAYIIITTAKPPYQGEISTQQQEYHLSTQRPFYKHPPTLRLKPLTTQNTKYAYVTKSPKFMLSPTTPAPFRHNSVTKQYEVKYVTTPPNYVPMKTSPSPANKLRPAIQYEENSSMSTPTADLNQYPQNNYALEDPNQLPDIHTLSLSEILHKLQASNHLPKTLTADNIDNSIKTLITILNNLKKSQKIVVNPPQHHDPPPVPTDYDYSNGNDDYHNNEEHEITLLPPPSSSGPNKHPGPSTGRAGIDYPNYSVIPQTSFECTQQRYKGFFGDPETNCQVWHYCDLNGGKSSFLCPNGTIFSQIALTCDWWFNVKCSTTSQLYVLNERLYKYILPFNPKFPEDYSGPLVDKYLAMKFQEMEEKMRLEKEKSAVKIEQEENHIEETTISEDGTTISSEKTKQKIDEQSSERNLLTDDISEDLAKKSSYVAFESSTKQTTSQTDYENEPVSLSIKPIVVSSTIEPDLSNETSSKDEEQENQDSTKEQSDTNEHESFQRSPNVLQENNEKNLVEHQNESKLDSSKISVEKVEVIEIKSDGTSGHLTPNMFYADIDSKS